MHVFQLVRSLVEIESITENEKKVALWLQHYLTQLGYFVSLHEAAPERFNVLALAGKPELVFSSHIDTVPPYIPFREDQDFLYGRGTCDAKGIVAAQIEAAEILRKAGENRLGLLFVVGEERNSTGALHANQNPIGSRFLVNGEPTDNKLAAGSKGAFRALISARGMAAHSAYPEAGESAILKLLDILNELRTAELPVDATLGPTTCNIGVIQGGTRANIIPDFARAEVMFRCTRPMQEIKKILQYAVKDRGDIEYLMEVPIQMMNVLAGFESSAVSFTTDVPFLSAWGRPYLLGPGSILDAHTDHERISKKELLAGIDLYVKLARRLLKEPE
jgi:acetylornithine deacetylase